MKFHDELYTPYCGGLGSEIRILNTRDRFDMLDDYINTLNPKRMSVGNSYLYILVSKYGEVKAQQENSFDLASMKIDRNRLIEHIGSLDDLRTALPSKDFVYDEQIKNYTFDQSLEHEMARYGLENLYPEYYGIEICILLNTYYCQCNSLITIQGADRETFYNTRTLMK